MRRLSTAAATLFLVSAQASAAAQPPAAPKPRATELTIAASGDFLIHGPVFQRALANGGGRRYDFRPMLRVIRPVIAGADIALCHMETPLTHGAPHGYPSFRTPAGLAPAIRATGWDACSTASNHTLDAGQAGVNTTLRALDKAGLRHSGSHRARTGSRRPVLLRAKGVKVAFLAYTALTNGQAIPHPWTLDFARAGRILSDAQRARRAGAQAVVVSIHWGEEYRHAPTAAQYRLAGALTRSKAITAVIGQHVHVVQPIRWINRKPVVFGEGNLLSNQTGACCPAASQDGLIALLDLRVGTNGARAVRVRYLPTWVRHPDYTVLRARGASRRRTIAVVGRSRLTRPIR